MFIIVSDPERLFGRGNEFERGDFATTLYRGCWPPGLVVRNTEDSRRYEVQHNGGKSHRQVLVALGGDVMLEALNNNGYLRRIEVRAAARGPSAHGR
jgi:hypothetical protein